MRKLGRMLLIFSMFPIAVGAKPLTVPSVFQSLDSIQKRKKKASIPSQYQLFFSAKTLLQSHPGLQAIESMERQLLESRMHSDGRALDKEMDELFYALELRRGELLVQNKSWLLARAAFARGTSGLSTFKWVNYWLTSTSEALAHVCTRNLKKSKARSKSQPKSQPDEFCLSIAKRVADAFPKGAAEVKVLRELPGLENISWPEVGGDRLSQTYTEKVDKDDEAFQPVLQAFIEGRKRDVVNQAQSFINAFPKSNLRFRARFLSAEINFKNGDKKEAEPLYRSLMDEVPLTFYAIVASERLGIPLRNRVKTEALQVDPENFTFNPSEQEALSRADRLYVNRKPDGVARELETLTRVRGYNDDSLLYLMSYGNRVASDITAFRLGSELIQRRSDKLLNAEMINLIFPERFNQAIETESKANHIDPVLVQSLMKQESAFRPDILSGSGAIGLMQLMPFTALEVKKDLLLSELTNPNVNIPIGVKYISGLLDRYEGNIPFALAAYNAGPFRVTKWRREMKPDAGMIEFMESIPFRETRDYVMSILRNRYWYQYRKGLPLQSVFTAWVVPSPKAPAVVAPNASVTALPPVAPSPTEEKPAETPPAAI